MAQNCRTSGNGCANAIHRHHNHLWPQLAEDRLIPTIIADGHHLPEEVIKVFVKVKGPDKIILTSDVNHLIGMPPGKYNYLGTEVVYSEDDWSEIPVRIACRSFHASGKGLKQ